MCQHLALLSGGDTVINGTLVADVLVSGQQKVNK